MSYFQKVNIKDKLLSNYGDMLRNCQTGGLLSALAHFTCSTEPAIISLPTGAGKTELMFAISFCVRPKRILIVEPSQFLRTQTSKRLRNLKLFREYGLLSNTDNPKVLEVETSRRNEKDWLQLADFDAVVATPNTISPKMELVSSPPEDLFDLVFIDEAHHSAAKTWKAIVNTFSTSKIVQLTATAFRRDRRRLPGRLIYHYPVGQALEDGIYRPVDFIPVERNYSDTTDWSIAIATAEKFHEELRINRSTALMIRTDRIANCDLLVDMYKELGIDAVEIHSNLSRQTSEDRLKQLRQGDVNAVVTVGMMAEGIDVPGLKIASLHAPPRSLPYTLQLVGRVSRTPEDQTGPAYFIAFPDHVRGEARKLFREDRDWRQFIPLLVEDAIREAHGDRADIILHDTSKSHIIPEILDPFFSVEVRKFVNPSGLIHMEKFPLEPDNVKGMPRDVESIELLTEVEDGCATIITTSKPAPVWGRSTDLIDIRHDLHVLYSPSETDILFILTTSKIIVNALIDTLLDKTVMLDPKNIQGALSEAIYNKYVAVGLENALGLTGPHPSYKMHLGSGAGTSIRSSDGKIFGPGHAMGWMIDNEVRGIATKNRKIWAMKRESLLDFISWCREVTSQILVPGSGLPGLDFLAEPVPASHLFTEKPIGIVVSDRHFSMPYESLIQKSDRTIKANIDPLFSKIYYQNSGMETFLTFRDDSEEINLSYSPGETQENWKVEDKREFIIKFPETNEKCSLEDFLNNHPPIIIMPNGGAIRGNYGWKIVSVSSRLDKSIFESLDWNNTDRTKETISTGDDRLNVMEKTHHYLINKLSNDLIVIMDDGANEIADYIAVDPSLKEIYFVHCKASSKPKPGNRIKDWYELLGQCARSQTWVRYFNLLTELDSRIDERVNTEIISNDSSREELKLLALDYKPNEWKFYVIAVQPGCLISKLLRTKDSHVYKSLGVINEWLMQAGANFIIWGSA